MTVSMACSKCHVVPAGRNIIQLYAFICMLAVATPRF